MAINKSFLNKLRSIKPTAVSFRAPSITQRLTISLAVTIMFISLMAIPISYLIEKQQIINKVGEQADERILFIRDTLAIPMWNFAYDEIQNIAQSQIKSVLVSSIRIVDSSGTVLFSEGEAYESASVTRDSKVFYEGQEIGYVEMTMAVDYPLEIGRQSLLLASLIILINIVCLAVAVIFLLPRLLGKPIKQISEIAKQYGSGKYDISLKEQADKEFQPVVSALEQMANQIRSQMTELRRSEERFRVASQIASDVVYERDLQTGIATFYGDIDSPLGYDPGEFPDTMEGWREHVHPEDLARIDRQNIDQMEPGILHSIEYRMRKKDGAYMIWWDRVMLIKDKETGRPLKFIGAATDITERKQAEEEIQQRSDTETTVNKLLKLSLEDLPIDEILKNSLDLVLSIPWLVLESRGSIFLVEGEPEVLVMKAQSRLSEPIQKMCARVPFGRCLCGRAALTQQVQFADCIDERHDNRYDGMNPHGHYCIPIKFHGEMLGVINTYIKEGHHYNKREEDFLVTVANTLAGIINSKLVEGALRASEERFKILFEYAPDAYYINDLEGNFIDGNRAAEKLTGYAKKELVGQNFLKLNMLLPQDMQKAAELLMKNVLGQPTGPDLFSLIQKDGKQVIVEISTFPVEIKGQALVLGIARDITERKQMEEQLIITDRLASVGELASGIAHELNNPLTGVIGLSQLLVEKDLPNDVKEDLKLVYSEAQRAANVVKGLLTFARRHSPLRQLVNVNDVIGKVLELRAYEQKVSNVEVVTNLSSDLPQISADYFQLQQVFLNIIINAEYFMLEAHNKGTLTIATEKIEDMVRISFADDGPGIPKKSFGHIFDPFFTTKEVGKGTGLGLSISHGIVSAHGGQIYAESELGKGATFIIELPIRQ